MYVSLQLQIVPNKSTNFSCLSDIRKNYSGQLFQK